MKPREHRRFTPHLTLGLFLAAGLALAFAPAPAHATSSDLVISQVYGGGGNAGAVYKNDFIEIFNRGTSPVSVAGWSVQYAASTGSTWSVTALSGSIPAGGYYLVQEAVGAGGTTNLPTPNAIGTIAMSATTGKVALVSSTTALTGTCPGGYVDLLGYGAANCFEGSAMAVLTNTTAALRASAGCTETDNNASDFSTGSPTPRNSSSPAHPCQHVLSTSVSPLAGGSVARNPDLPNYPDGSSVQLTAVPALGYHFVSWSGDASGNTNPLNVTMNAPKSITANFALDQHTLAVATVGSGSVAKVPDQPTYDYGASVQLTAAPAVGWHFVGWSGDATGNTNPLDVTMDADKNITATFEIDQHTLAVATVGSGAVAKAPDQPSYDFGASVQLTATPAVGWHFVGWSGDATGNTNPLDVTMDADKSITATFEIDQHTLALATVGSGSVAKAPDQPSYDFGASVQLTATPAVGWNFIGWSGDATGNTNPLDVTMDADKSITATFAIDQHSLAVATVGSGSVAKSPDQPSYDFGASVQLTATPAVGWHFVGWSGDATGNTNPLDVTMDANKNITATFEIDQHTLATATVGSGSLAKDPDQFSYDYGTVVQLTATPSAGWHFAGWSGDASGNTNPTSVTMTADRSVTATFEIDQHTLAVATVGSGSVAKVPDQASYDYGSVVQLTAAPAAGWHFVGWSGDASGNTNPTSVTMTADRSVTATFGENSVVVSQVYGGGGNAGSTWTNDFIELFNHGPDPIDVTGWTVQYASATGNTWSTTALSGVIPAGRYYLVQETAGAGGTTPLPAPDATGTIVMSATAGKVVLVNNSTALTGTCPAGAAIEDMVGYGAANCSETSPVAALTNITAARRNSNGCQDSDNNSADFSVGAPTPRNSASPANSCLFTLAVSTVGAGSVVKSPDQAGYVSGAVVQLTATAVSGNHFDHWSGGATGSSNPLSLVMDDDKVVTAHFVANGLSGQVVISQVYGGGGNAGATYKNDYVELFNRGNVAVSVTGWSIQYGSNAGTTWATTTLVGTIQPGGYYLVQEAQGVGGTTDLPAPDGIGVINLGSTDGKVALCSNNVVLTGACPGSAALVDLVGYGAANCSEGSPALPVSSLTASLRNHGGCDESNDNSADFAGGAPVPHNTASPIHVCDIWLDAGPVATTEFALSPAAPNPSRGVSRIPFSLPVQSRVRLSVMDVQGRVVVDLVDGVMPAGRHEAIWNGMTNAGPARAGLYFISFEVPGHRFSRSVVLMR